MEQLSFEFSDEELCLGAARGDPGAETELVQRGALAGAFLAPFLYGLYWKGVTKASVWASFICGIGITVSNMFFGYIDSPINAGAIAMVAGLVVVPIVSLLTPKMKKEEVDGIFECLEEKVMVEQKLALPKEDE